MLKKILSLLFVILFCFSVVVFAAGPNVSGKGASGPSVSGIGASVQGETVQQGDITTDAAGNKYYKGEKLVSGGGGTSGPSASGIGASDCFGANRCFLSNWRYLVPIVLFILVIVLTVNQIYTSLILRKIYTILKDK
jgi:hypothetical protein